MLKIKTIDGWIPELSILWNHQYYLESNFDKVYDSVSDLIREDIEIPLSILFGSGESCNIKTTSDISLDSWIFFVTFRILQTQLHKDHILLLFPFQNQLLIRLIIICYFQNLLLSFFFYFYILEELYLMVHTFIIQIFGFQEFFFSSS